MRPIRAVGIVGAGIMGAAIAREHAARGFSVVLCDNDPEALRRAARAGGPTSVRYTLSLADLAGCDLVLESIAEKRPAKEALYRQLAPHLVKDAVLATNTSTIPIARLAAGLAAPSHFCGLHFCHPVHLRPLTEIIPGAGTSAETVVRLASHALSLGKLPIVVRDGPGFIVNRLLMAYLNAALDLLLTGLPPSAIDAAMVGFGMTLGPLALLDEIGLDTALQSGVVLSEVAEQRSAGTELLVALVKSKQLGVKTGAGIYTYPAQVINPSLELLLNARSFPAATQRLDDNQLAAKLLRPIVEEAQRLLAEKKASAAWEIDLATIFGLGFPCWRGGLLWWAEKP